MDKVIYRIWHNESDRGKVGYIGKDARYPSRVNLLRRQKDSRYPKLHSALNKYPLHLWNVEILASGFETNEALIIAEKHWIKEFDSKNKGYNCTDGGEGLLGFKHSAATKIKMSASNRIAQLGKRASPETRMKMRLARLGHPVSQETRAKLSTKTHSPETKQKIAEANRRRVISDETRLKISAARRKQESLKALNNSSAAVFEEQTHV